MLIIFDLDDTLIDTSRAITPKRHRAVFETLNLKGWEHFIEINREATSSRQAFEIFFNKMGFSHGKLEKACSLLGELLPEDFEVPTTPGAQALIERLYPSHTLALVTLGNEELQLQKMKKAGIQPEIFSKLIVSSGPSKKQEYQKILVELGFSPEDSVVCGDRIAVDLTPAKALGFTTIHYPRGRGAGKTGNLEDVDFTITKLEDLERYLYEHKSALKGDDK